MYEEAGKLYVLGEEESAKGGTARHSLRDVQVLMREKHGVTISFSSVRHAAATYRQLRSAADKEPAVPFAPKHGAPTLLSVEMEQELLNQVKLLRSLNLPVFRDDLCTIGITLKRVEDPGFRPDKNRLSNGWYPETVPPHRTQREDLAVFQVFKKEFARHHDKRTRLAWTEKRSMSVDSDWIMPCDEASLGGSDRT